MVTSLIHWQVPSKLKKFDVPIVCFTANNRIMTFATCRNSESHWKWLVDKYHVEYWAFQSEIIPIE